MSTNEKIKEKKCKSQVIATTAFVSASGFAVIFISLKVRD